MSTVDEILATQQQIAKAIEHILTNFKKDGAERKTPEYLQRRVDILDGYWHEFSSNHNKLSEFGIETHSYYSSDEYERVRERYNAIRSHIQTYQVTEIDRPRTPVLKPPTFVGPASDSRHPSPSTRGTASKTEEMLRKQQSNFKAFQHSIINLDLDLISEKWEFEDVLRTLQTRWAVIDALHWELDSELNGSNKEYEEVFASSEKQYCSIKKAINKKMWSVSHREKSIPQMEIPTFNGNYNNWVSFKDLFTETIHSNNSMSLAQKMQYLKSKVRGEAEKLIMHLKVSSDNYNVCWDILNQRYNNKKLIFTSHINILLNLPATQQQTIQHLKRVHDTTLECLNAIKNLGIDISTWDPLIVHILSQKLDSESYMDYVESVEQPRDLPNLKEFLNFLESKFTTLESARRKQENPTQRSQVVLNKNQTFHPNNNQKQSYYKNSFSSSSRVTTKQVNRKVPATTNYRCSLCNSNDHGIYYCQNFLDMSPYQRQKAVAKLNLCSNCLYNHQENDCISEKRCRECNKRHNSLLHDAFTQSGHQPTEMASAGGSVRAGGVSHPSANAGKITRSSSHVRHSSELIEVLLPTAMINVQGADGLQYTMRALLDQGSQTSLITEHAAQVLKIPRTKCRGVISGVGDKESNSKGMIHFKVSSLINDFSFETEALIMNQLIKNLPSVTMSKPDWVFLNNIKLADPEFYQSRPVDLLLGADVYSIILQDGLCKSNSTLTTAQQTQLGWILSGNTKTFQCNVVMHNMEDIQNFWEIEDISETADLSTEDQKCMDYYQKTTVRREDGRYEVRLPLKSNYQENLGQSKHKAIAQFHKLEKTFKKQTSTANGYKTFINELISLGHMIPATDSCYATPDCYLPHHCVTRQESTTTKLRVVFNASSKTTTGYSLNDVMCRGPNLQQDLQCLLIKWRQYKYAFTADVEKMFLQIQLNTEDQNLQKIVWRDHESQKLMTYLLTTVTFGTKAAPFLAMMTIKQLARDEKGNYQDSTAPSVLEESCYMDDVIHGSHHKDMANKLKTDLIDLLKRGGFNLRKWKSNLPELMEGDQNNEIIFNFKQLESTKTLGIGWNPQTDCFTFKPKPYFSFNKCTKRSLLSDISKLFDPLGWLTPLSTKLKIIFQDIWKTNIQWDDFVPDEIQTEWRKVSADIELISDYHVPRWLGVTENDSIELHGFCDASNKAYACVVYRKINRRNVSTLTIVAGKAKLVPLNKNTSLPRLELSGALLLSKLMAKIKICLKDHNIKIYGWCDSMVVLGWLQGDPERWKPFVANRVKQIITVMPSTCWHYVKSNSNPADSASRGLTASQLKDHAIWWKGPNWLTAYQMSNETTSNYSTNQEERKIKLVNMTQLPCKNDIINQLLTKFSSLSKATRVLSWILRFIYKKHRLEYLTLDELREARTRIIKQVQLDEFAEEIIKIKQQRTVSCKSKLFEFNPILDENGVLRIAGRLRHANIEPDAKHPTIIPNNTRLADLIIDEAHQATYHGGARLTTAFMRRKYWLIGGIKATKNRLRRCVTCRKHNPDQTSQIMGDLPPSRSNPSRPFHKTGVDYTGHVLIKANKGRGIKTTKGYVAVFVCMSTKAVHLELVSDLTASAFLAALRRMAARRGVPGHIYSDQGTNFIGANNVLQQEYEHLEKMFNTDFMNEVRNMGVEWHFNAPAWPSAGGLWEAAVKSLKYHLKRVIGEQRLTFEEYSTLLAQIEGCLNSRPLCPLTEDPNDLDALTPSHFLASGPILNVYETEKDLRTRWTLTQAILKDVWDRWRNEYLTQLASRSKWRKPQRNIQLNDVVIIREENLPPGKWALGRVIQLHPGNDGYVRVVTLKTKSGILKRPVVKVSVLPVFDHNQEPIIQQQDAIPAGVESKEENISRSSSSSRKRKPYSFTSMAISLLLFIMTLISTTHCAYNVTPLQNTTMYFDTVTNMHIIRDEWRLVVYHDTTPYREGNTALLKYISYLDHLCLNIKEISHCDGIVLQLRHEYSELQYYNNILSMKADPKTGTRRRRGLIDGVGNIANSLFGVLDSHFAEKYEQDIQLIKDNQKHLASLWRNQTSVVEAELNLLNRTGEIFNKHHKIVNNKINVLEMKVNQLKLELQNTSLTNEFISTAIMANNVLSSLKTVQQTLLDAISNMYGKLNFHLLTPKQLKDELNIIASQLPKDLALPVDNYAMYEIYHLLKIRTRVTGKYVIFEIKIPLITRDIFEILNLIPIPNIKSNNKQTSVVPIADFVAINIKKDAYIPFTEKNLDSCLQRDPKVILCYLNKPIYKIKDDESLCEIHSKSRLCKTVSNECDNKWKALNRINTYFYSCCDRCHIKLLCGDQITAVQMTRAGLFTVDQGCIIKSADFLVYSHSQQVNKLSISSVIEAPEISPINHIINISLPEPPIPDNDPDNLNYDQLLKIKEQIDLMKQNEPLSEKVSYHDIHHYAAIYVMFTVVAVCAAALVWRRCRRGRAQAAPAPAAAQPAPAFATASTTAATSSAGPEPIYAAPRPSIRNQCSESEMGNKCNMFELNELSKQSARLTKSNKSTSPVLRSVFSISNSNV